MRRTRDAEAERNLPPGFRFHPTDEELVVHYLCRQAAAQRPPAPIIAEVDLYKYDPWDLPEMALFGRREWYFFTPTDRKYPNGLRPNRTAGSGYWKATGADKPVAAPGSGRPLAIKKALVFYHGKAPKGVKTDWIMHEYRLADTNRSPTEKGGLRKNVREKKPLRTPESDAENGAFSGDQAAEKRKEDPGDWLMEFNLDSKRQNPFAGVDAPPAFDVLGQDYCSLFLASPNLKPSPMNMPPSL